MECAGSPHSIVERGTDRLRCQKTWRDAQIFAHLLQPVHRQAQLLQPRLAWCSGSVNAEEGTEPCSVLRANAESCIQVGEQRRAWRRRPHARPGRLAVRNVTLADALQRLCGWQLAMHQRRHSSERCGKTCQAEATRRAAVGARAGGSVKDGGGAGRAQRGGAQQAAALAQAKESATQHPRRACTRAV